MKKAPRSSSDYWNRAFVWGALIFVVGCRGGNGPDVSINDTSVSGNAGGSGSSHVPELVQGPEIPLVPSWRVVATPDFRASGVEIGGDSVFFHNVTTAGFFDHGGFVVGIGSGPNGQNVLIYFGSDAQINSTVGRTGTGPGEFGRLSQVFVGSGEVAVLDSGLRRVSWFSTNGELTGTLPLTTRFTEPVGLIENGELVMTVGPYSLEPDQDRPYVVLSRNGEIVSELKGHRDPPHMFTRIEGIAQRGSERRTVFVQGALGSECFPEPIYLTVPGALILASDDGSLFAMNRSGGMREIFRATKREIITQQSVQKVEEFLKLLERQLQYMQATSFRDESRTLERLGRIGGPVPATWSKVLADTQGNIWLQSATCFAETPSRGWEIVDPLGRLVGIAEIPSSLKILAVNGNKVLGLTADDLGVEYLTLYTLEQRR